MQDQKSDKAVYAHAGDIDKLPKLFRSEVASWLDTDEMIHGECAGDEYVKLCGCNDEQLDARIDLLKNPPIGTNEVEIISEQYDTV